LPVCCKCFCCVVLNAVRARIRPAMSVYTKAVVAKNVRIRGNLATLSKHLVAGGMLQCTPFNISDDEDSTDSREFTNAYIESIHLVSSHVSLPYDVELDVWNKQLILQSGEMQRTATTLIPIKNVLSTYKINLLALQDNTVDWYGIIKHFDWPSVDTTCISNTDTLDFDPEHVKLHTTEHKHDKNTVVLSCACRHINVLYKAAAYLVQQKSFHVSVLLNRTPGFWYMSKKVLDASVEFLQELKSTNEKLEIGACVCAHALTILTTWV